MGRRHCHLAARLGGELTDASSERTSSAGVPCANERDYAREDSSDHLARLLQSGGMMSASCGGYDIQLLFLLFANELKTVLQVGEWLPLIVR